MYIIISIILTLNIISSLYDIVQSYLLWSLCIVSYYLLSLRLVNNKILSHLGKYSFYIFLLNELVIGTGISILFNNIICCASYFTAHIEITI